MPIQQREDELLHPATMRAAIDAALLVAADPAFDAKKREPYVRLLNRIVKETADNSEVEVVRYRAIAAVVSVLMLGHPRGEGWAIHKPSRNEARARLTGAIFVHHNVIALPPIVREMATRLLLHFPKRIEAAQQVRVMANFQQKKKRLFNNDDFAPYRRLAEPIGLVPAPDTKGLSEALDRDFPWMAGVTRHILREMALGEYAGRAYLRLPRLLMVGDPGVGKTYYVKALASLMRAPFRMISAAGESDSMSLRGTSAGWSSARPSVVIQAMLQFLVANPVFLIDEIEKAGESRLNGALQDTLLPMLDPLIPWLCPALETEIDLSYCNFLATANTLSSVSRPLLDRMQIVHAPKPSREHFPLIIDSVLKNLAAELQLRDYRLLPEIPPEERDHLVQNCDNVRQLARAVRRIVADKASLLSRRSATIAH